jgi:hypothetical protein
MFRRRSKKQQVLGKTAKLVNLYALAKALRAIWEGAQKGRSRAPRPGVIAAGAAAAVGAGLAARKILSRRGDEPAYPPPPEDTVPSSGETVEGARTPPAQEMAESTDTADAVEGSDASVEAEESVTSRRKE